jgi:drug/metabolite transporter (DMT)-like permease
MLELQNSNLIKLGGLSCILGGLLFILGVSLHPLRDGRSVLAAIYYAEIHMLIALSLMFSLLGLIALYLRHEKRLGKVGWIGMIVAFVGNIWTFAAILVDGFRWPVVTSLDPALVHNIPAAPYSVQFLIVPIALFALGYVLSAIAAVKAAVLPRLAGTSIAIGAATYFSASLSIGFLGPESATTGTPAE